MAQAYIRTMDRELAAADPDHLPLYLQQWRGFRLLEAGAKRFLEAQAAITPDPLARSFTPDWTTWKERSDQALQLLEAAWLDLEIRTDGNVKTGVTPSVGHGEILECSFIPPREVT